MRTQILSLLLALLAISNFSLAQYKHTHSVPFHNAVVEMYDLGDDIIFHNEAPIGKLKESTNLKVFEDEDKEATFGMFMDQSKYQHFQTIIKKHEKKFTTDCFTWVFEIQNFKDRCAAKKIGEFKLKENGFFTLGSLKWYDACERISKLMGIDIYPEHIWLCTFKVTLDKVFRPAYQTNIRAAKFKKDDNNYWQVESETIDNLTEQLINGNDNMDIQHISPKKWLGLLQKSKEYPWTRLGYTYDWGNTTDHEGVSEFVIVPGTTVSEVNFYEIAKKQY